MKIVYIFTLAVIFLSMTASYANAEIVTKNIEYKQGDQILEGFLAYDDAIKGKMPGVLVIHEWWGLNDFAREKAKELARMGYVAFAVDMYGRDKVTSDPAQAAEWASAVRGKPLMRERAAAGLEVLRNQKMTDKNKIAAIGFCFGGTGVLELAYSGADIAGVVSFHGGITSPKPEVPDRIKAKILVLHGAIDPHVTKESIAAFRDSMEKAGADWQMVCFGGAVHSFTNPASGNDKTRGVAYNEKAARRSWKYMKDFFDEIFR